MSLSAKFDHDVYRRLEKRAPSFEWTKQETIGGPTKERVDVAGRPKARMHGKRSYRVFIEAELRREDPVSNILKVWTRFLKGEYQSPIIFFQGFSRIYRSPRYSNRRIKAAVAREFGQMLEQQSKSAIRYIPIPMRYLPISGKHEGNGARRDAAFRFADRIVAHLKRLNVRVA